MLGDISAPSTHSGSVSKQVSEDALVKGSQDIICSALVPIADAPAVGNHQQKKLFKAQSIFASQHFQNVTGAGAGEAVGNPTLKYDA